MFRSLFLDRQWFQWSLIGSVVILAVTFVRSIMTLFAFLPR